MALTVHAVGFAHLFSVKEDSEILNAKKAAFLASKVMQNFVVEKIEDIIDKNKKVKHIKLSGKQQASSSQLVVNLWEQVFGKSTECNLHSFSAGPSINLGKGPKYIGTYRTGVAHCIIITKLKQHSCQSTSQASLGTGVWMSYCCFLNSSATLGKTIKSSLLLSQLPPPLLLVPSSEITEEVITDPPKIGVKLKQDNVDIAYPPLFQSGGHYDLKLNAACDDNNLHDGEWHGPCSCMVHKLERTSSRSWSS